jgi:hypothetical protein
MSSRYDGLYRKAGRFAVKGGLDLADQGRRYLPRHQPSVGFSSDS